VPYKAVFPDEVDLSVPSQYVSPPVRTWVSLSGKPSRIASSRPVWAAVGRILSQ